MSDIVLIVTLYLCIEAVSEWEGVGWGPGSDAWDNFSILLLLYLDREPGDRH